MENPYFNVQGDTLVITHNSGFFSNCSIALFGIVGFYMHYQRLPDYVNFDQTFRNFTGHNTGDVYPEYFEYRRDMDIPYTGKFQMSWHPLFDYRLESFQQLAPFVEKYFSPADDVLAIADQLTDKYAIDFSNTLVICYRGTDKHEETGIGSSSDYVEKAKSFLRFEPDLRVLVQTDQKQFLDYCHQELDNVFNIKELPVTDAGTVMHKIIPSDSKIAWTKTFVAVTKLLSGCKYIINHSGNVARWICLYRGGTEGAVQYLKPKELPQDATGYFWLS